MATRAHDRRRRGSVSPDTSGGETAGGAVAGDREDIPSIADLVRALPEDLRDAEPSDLHGLTIRVRNALASHDILRLRDLETVSEETMLAQWRNFGAVSLARLRLALERRVLLPRETVTSPVLRPAGKPSGRVPESVAALPPAAHGLDLSYLPDTQRQTAAALASGGIRFIGDLAAWSDQDLYRLPRLGESGLDRLVRGLSDLAERLKGLPPEALADAAALSNGMILRRSLPAHVDRAVEELGPRRRRVLDARYLGGGDAVSLVELGAEFGVTRERVRQLEAKALRTLDPRGDLRRRADARITVHRAGRREPLLLEELPRRDAWFAGASTDRLAEILRMLGCEHRVVQWPDGPPFVAPGALARPTRLRRRFIQGAGYLADDAALLAEVRRFLEAESASELVPAFLDLLGLYVLTSEGIQFDVSTSLCVETLLRRARAPLALEEIHRRLARLGRTPSLPSLRNMIDSAWAVCSAPGTYVHRDYLPHRSRLEEPGARDRLCDAVDRIFRADLSRQWNVIDLRGALRHEGIDWAEDLPTDVLDGVLRTAPDRFRNLGRLTWVSARAKSRTRKHQRAVMIEILEEAGTPLPRQELLRRARAQRSIPHSVGLFWPLAQIADGRIGLGPRDLGLPDAAWRRVAAEVREALRREGRVPVDQIRQWLAEHGPSGLAIPTLLLLYIFRLGSTVLLDGPEPGEGLRRADLPRIPPRRVRRRGSRSNGGDETRARGGEATRRRQRGPSSRRT